MNRKDPTGLVDEFAAYAPDVAWKGYVDENGNFVPTGVTAIDYGYKPNVPSDIAITAADNLIQLLGLIADRVETPTILWNDELFGPLFNFGRSAEAAVIPIKATQMKMENNCQD